MLSLQKYLMVAGVAVAALAIIPGQSVRAELNQRVDALAQAENSSALTRVKRWTRTSFEAAKKHWAEDQAKFQQCSRNHPPQGSGYVSATGVHKDGDKPDESPQ